MPRQSDNNTRNYALLRRERKLPQLSCKLGPGHLMIPATNTSLGSIISSSVCVTVFDRKHKRGGACHFVRPKPPTGQKPTTLDGLAAITLLVKKFFETDTKLFNLVVGMYGGAYPEWARAGQKQLAQENVEIVRKWMKRKGLSITDEDVGGRRGRKLVYVTGTNEHAIFKTDAIRRTDWFPES